MKYQFLAIITLFSLFSCHHSGNSNSGTAKETSINPDSLAYISNPDQVLLTYLNNQYVLTEDDTTYISNDQLGLDNCAWQLSYSNGTSFQYSECEEWGPIVTVSFRNLDKRQIIDLVNQHFTTKGYSWHENYSEFRPNQFYEYVWTFRIIEKGNITLLEYSYAW